MSPSFRELHLVCSYLFTLLGGLDIDLGPLLKGLPENMSDQRFPSNLHGDHVPGSFQHCLGSGELTTNIIFGQLYGLSRELFSLMTLVTVSQIFSKLLWGQAKLFGQAVYSEETRKGKMKLEKGCVNKKTVMSERGLT